MHSSAMTGILDILCEYIFSYPPVSLVVHDEGWHSICIRIDRRRSSVNTPRSIKRRLGIVSLVAACWARSTWAGFARFEDFGKRNDDSPISLCQSKSVGTRRDDEETR